MNSSKSLRRIGFCFSALRLKRHDRKAAIKVFGAVSEQAPSPLSVLSGALKIADKYTIAMEAVGNKIRVNSQGWEDAR
jgi:hypothetical protein